MTVRPQPLATEPQLGRRSALRWLAAGSGLLCTGCVNSLVGQKNQYGPPPAGATQADIFRHLNANISRIFSWRSTNVTIRARTGLPMQVSGVIAVETPRNFRLRVSSIGGEEADFGSNPERFWFWIRRNEPKHVFTARHDDLGRASQKLPLPFQTDWLIEVLGVIQLDESQFTVQNTDSKTLTVTMTSEQLSPNGQPVKRLLVVDAGHGVVLGHSLYDARGQLIAKAAMRNYRYHPQSQVSFPHCIDLDWPQAGMAMTLTIGRDVEINPPALDPKTFELPHMAGYPVHDLGA